ncbi:MAG: dihydropteroate synthase [Anaerolineae bacterium]|nr:dihydropteroate synthase [Anaerolineae bacterium]
MSAFNSRVVRLETAAALRSEMKKIGSDPRGIEIMVPKGLFLTIKIEDVKYAAASIIKQEMLAKGGEAALGECIYFGDERRTDMLLMGTKRHYRRLLAKLRIQPLESLTTLAVELKEALENYEARDRSHLTIGARDFRWGERTFVMGIINVTPDSFSGDGILSSGVAAGVTDGDAGDEATIDAAVAQGLRQVKEGADILDVGGESTRPGSSPVTAEEELRRVLPVIRRLAATTDVPISIDTYKASVAEAALDAGAHLVNDVWALGADPDIAALVADRGVPVILMHNRSRPKEASVEARLGGRYLGGEYQDLMADIIRELRQAVESALEAGIPANNIIVDPGIGFGKTVKQNLHLLNHLDELEVMGYPILLGPSRKSFIGYTLDLPPEERLEGTAATVALGIARGADIVRVHDVREMVRVAKMADAMVRDGC